MTLQTLIRAIPWPNIANGDVSAKTLANGTSIDAAGEYQALIFRADEAMTISHVAFRASQAVGSPTIEVRIETVDATTGLPTGTLWGTNTNIVSGTLTAAWQTVALTASASIAAGDVLAVKFLYVSGTQVSIGQVNGAGVTPGSRFPYSVGNTGTPTAAPLTRPWNIALGSSATTFYRVPWLLPVSAAATLSFSTTNGDAFGNRFQVPFKCRCSGVHLPLGSSTGEFSHGLYDDSGTELSSSSTLLDVDLGTNSAGYIRRLMFDNPVLLSPATWYRVAFWPSSTTNVQPYKYTTQTDASEAMPYTNFHYTTKATGGAWTDTAVDEAVVLDLLIDQLDDGVGGSAGVRGYGSAS